MQVSNLKLSKFSFQSSIKRFSRRRDPVGLRLPSGCVSADDKDRLKWSCQLYPNGMQESCKDYLSLFAAFQSTEQTVANLRRRVELSILDARGQKRNRVSFEDTFTANHGRGFGKFISRKRLLDESNGLLPDDTLTICCQVEDVQDEQVADSGDSSCKRVKLQVSSDLEKHFDNRFLSDVTISVDGRDFWAHKVILAARSAVFAAMFHFEMQNKVVNNRVEVTDINQDVFEWLLRFMYTGDCVGASLLAEEFLVDLLIAAEKYDIQDLKRLLQDILAGKLNIANAVQTLIISDIYSAAQLKQKAVEFIVGHSSSVVDSKDWKNMIEHPKLINELIILLAKPRQM